MPASLGVKQHVLKQFPPAPSNLTLLSFVSESKIKRTSEYREMLVPFHLFHFSLV
jgi:hypothetical protein